LLDKIAALVTTRDDLADNEEGGNLVSIYPVLPGPGDTLDDDLKHILSETSYLQYRGTVLEDLPKKCLYFLLSSQGLTARTELTETTCELLQGTMTSHMLLDRTASDCIHLLPPAHAGIATAVGGKPHNNSLFGILNQCKTLVGSRLLQMWLRQPLVQLEPLQKRQDAVSALVTNSIGCDRLRDEGLAGLMDFDKLSAKLGSFKEGLVGSPSGALECIFKLHLIASQQVPQLNEALGDVIRGMQENDQVDQTGLLVQAHAGLERVLNELARATDLVEEVLDMDEAPREYLVKASFSEELQELKQELDNVEAELDDCHNQMNERWYEVTGEQNQVRLEVTGEHEWRFRVPNTNSVKTLQSDLQDEVEVHKILKNGAYFSTRELRQVARKKIDLLADYDNHQRGVVDNACKVAATYAPVIERVSALVAELDVLAGLARVATYSSHGYCKPELTDGEEDGLGIVLKQARHPCVELQENVDFIPNDISLVFGESSFCLVTGPNMGGKSTYIRALGAIVTMAQIGSFVSSISCRVITALKFSHTNVIPQVPCASAKINLVHHILARVGAGDAQNRGISTFMSEMLEASSILHKATKRSLIIIDELGRGTSTYDGYGLASAISEYLIQRVGCCTVFATHFHELTALPSVQNCHVTAQSGPQGLTFLYEIRPGPCLESFGIQVAELAHVPRSVIEEARKRAQELERFEYRKRQADESHSQHMVRKFRRLPLKSYATANERRAALQQWVQEYKSSQ
jgi:DNA mismatch repair ATPase MutS